jgi:hypothetical protein
MNYEVKTSSERVESVKNDIINSLGAFQEYNVLQKFAMIPPVSLLKISQKANSSENLSFISFTMDWQRAQYHMLLKN